MANNYDIETIKSELPYIKSSEWYKRLLAELGEYKSHRMKSMLTCSDLQRLGSLQGMVKAVDDILNKITRED